LWIAGTGDRALEIVGRYADGWLPTGLSPEEFAHKRARVREVATAAGRPLPVCGFFPLTLLGDSREQIAAAYEAQPLARLVTLFGPASMWRRHGLEHPSGPECRGHPDTIPHAVEPQKLRELARRIPFAMMEDYLLLGNADEIAARLRPYAEAGLEHVVLGDFTGLTFAPEEAGRLLTTQMARLRQLLSAM
jgi:phthiodiolone/phenolphthiodiolone dimycocerosates ketoreductase